jgi:hypothetical protein
MKKKIQSKKMNRFYRFAHGVTCHLTALSLLYTPAAFAQSSFLEGASDVIQGVGGLAQDFMAQQQMAQQQQQQQQMMAQYHPQSQMVPSKLFPNCQVLKARSDFPSGACENVPMVGDVMSVNQSMAFRDIADDFDNHIANLLTTNQNSTQPVGLQCIKESGAKVGEEIQNRINALEAQITFVRKSTQQFKEQNRKIIEEMDVLKGDLYGGASQTQQKSQDFLKNFSSGCKTWFGVTANNEARQSGLTGLETQSSVINEVASQTIANEQNMTRDIVSQLNGLDKRIKQNGISSFSELGTIKTALSMGGSGQSYKVLDTLIEDKTNLLKSDVAAISSDLREVGFNIGLQDFDRNFKSRFVDFAKTSATYFKKKAINDCVTNDDGMGLGMNTDQILNSLKIREVGLNQTTLTSYKDQLLSILNSNAFIDKKLSLIEKLDSDFGVGEVYLTYTNASGSRISATTYGLYKDQIAACETKISNTNGFGLEKSDQERINRANQALQKAIALEKSFRNDLKQSLYDRVVNCEGIETKQEDCSFKNTSVMKSDDNNYCISNAVSCAGQVNTCQSEVNTVVELKKTEMQSLATQYNANVSGLIAQQETLLNQIKTQAIADAEYLKQYFDQSDYIYPKDLFVEMPLEELHEGYGVALRGKGDLSQIEGLPAQLDKLKKMLQDQKEKVGMSILDYGNSQKDGMLAEKERWATLAKRCANVEQGYNEAVAKQQQAMQEQQAASSNFCRKYDRIRTNPAAACGSADSLAEDMSNINQSVDPNAVDIASDFINYCQSSQNERNREGDSQNDREPASEAQSPTAKLISACRSQDWDGHAINSRLEAKDLGLNAEEIDTLVGRFDTSKFSDLTGVAAEAYCNSFGKSYTASTDDDTPGTCESTQGLANTPDVCSYFQYQAYLLQGDKTPAVALNDFYESVTSGSSQMEDDAFVKPIASLYGSYSVTNSSSGNIGEDMRSTNCLAVNTNGVGENQTDDTTSRTDSILDALRQ